MNNILYPNDFSQYVIGEKHPVLHARSASTNTSAALNLISQARRSVEIYTHNLDPRILDNREIAETIISFIKISPHSHLRVLLKDPSFAVKHGHRLIELSRKFSSFISIRKIHNQYLTKPFSFIVVDNRALLYRPHGDLYDAVVNYRAGKESRNQTDFFNEVWERSEPVSEIRQLYI